MDIELINRMLDACYQAKRIRDMLPPLPEGLGSSYIQYLDTIQKLNRQGIQVKVSDVSNALTIPRPGVTRTLKDIEAKGLIQKLASTEDGRVTYLTITESGKQLLDKYGEQYFNALAPFMDEISEEEAEGMIRTIDKFHQIMQERRISIDK